MSAGRTFTVAALLAAASAVGYAIYFDHQRRSSPSFRKSLKKRISKQEKQLKESHKQEQVARAQEVASYLAEELARDPIPADSDPNAQQLAFSAYIEQGDRLAAVPGNEMEAAAKFYKALTVYPNAAELLGIYQKSLPEKLYENVVLMIAAIPPANISSFLEGDDAATSGPTPDVD